LGLSSDVALPVSSQGRSGSRPMLQQAMPAPRSTQLIPASMNPPASVVQQQQQQWRHPAPASLQRPPTIPSAFRAEEMAWMDRGPRLAPQQVPPSTSPPASMVQYQQWRPAPVPASLQCPPTKPSALSDAKMAWLDRGPRLAPPQQVPPFMNKDQTPAHPTFQGPMMPTPTRPGSVRAPEMARMKRGPLLVPSPQQVLPFQNNGAFGQGSPQRSQVAHRSCGGTLVGPTSNRGPTRSIKHKPERVTREANCDVSSLDCILERSYKKRRVTLEPGGTKGSKKVTFDSGTYGRAYI